MDDLNLYDDLDEFQEQQEKKSKELQDVEDRYAKALKTIQSLEEDNKGLQKKIQRIELSFQSLLDTARTEIKRKDKEIERLRKEKDDICFRRKFPKRPQETTDSAASFQKVVETTSATTKRDGLQPKELEQDFSKAYKPDSGGRTRERSSDRFGETHKRHRSRDDRDSEYHKRQRNDKERHKSFDSRRNDKLEHCKVDRERDFSFKSDRPQKTDFSNNERNRNRHGSECHTERHKTLRESSVSPGREGYRKSRSQQYHNRKYSPSRRVGHVDKYYNKSTQSSERKERSHRIPTELEENAEVDKNCLESQKSPERKSSKTLSNVSLEPSRQLKEQHSSHAVHQRNEEHTHSNVCKDVGPLQHESDVSRMTDNSKPASSPKNLNTSDNVTNHPASSKNIACTQEVAGKENLLLEIMAAESLPNVVTKQQLNDESALEGSNENILNERVTKESQEKPNSHIKKNRNTSIANNLYEDLDEEPNTQSQFFEMEDILYENVDCDPSKKDLKQTDDTQKLETRLQQVESKGNNADYANGIQNVYEFVDDHLPERYLHNTCSTQNVNSQEINGIDLNSLNETKGSNTSHKPPFNMNAECKLVYQELTEEATGCQTPFTNEVVQKSEKEIGDADNCQIPFTEPYKSLSPPKLCTPRKVALFDSLFGPSPSSASSAGSNKILLTNIMGIIPKSGEIDKDSTTTPSEDYSDCATTTNNDLDWPQNKFDMAAFEKCFAENTEETDAKLIPSEELSGNSVMIVTPSREDGIKNGCHASCQTNDNNGSSNISDKISTNTSSGDYCNNGLIVVTPSSEIDDVPQQSYDKNELSNTIANNSDKLLDCDEQNKLITDLTTTSSGDSSNDSFMKLTSSKKVDDIPQLNNNNIDSAECCTFENCGPEQVLSNGGSIDLTEETFGEEVDCLERPVLHNATKAIISENNKDSEVGDKLQSLNNDIESYASPNKCIEMPIPNSETQQKHSSEETINETCDGTSDLSQTTNIETQKNQVHILTADKKIDQEQREIKLNAATPLNVTRLSDHSLETITWDLTSPTKETMPKQTNKDITDDTLGLKANQTGVSSTNNDTKKNQNIVTTDKIRGDKDIVAVQIAPDILAEIFLRSEEDGVSSSGVETITLHIKENISVENTETSKTSIGLTDLNELSSNEITEVTEVSVVLLDSDILQDDEISKPSVGITDLNEVSSNYITEVSLVLRDSEILQDTVLKGNLDQPKTNEFSTNNLNLDLTTSQTNKIVSVEHEDQMPKTAKLTDEKVTTQNVFLETITLDLTSPTKEKYSENSKIALLPFKTNDDISAEKVNVSEFQNSISTTVGTIMEDRDFTVYPTDKLSTAHIVDLEPFTPQSSLSVKRKEEKVTTELTASDSSKETPSTDTKKIDTASFLTPKYNPVTENVSAQSRDAVRDIEITTTESAHKLLPHEPHFAIHAITSDPNSPTKEPIAKPSNICVNPNSDTISIKTIADKEVSATRMSASSRTNDLESKDLTPHNDKFPNEQCESIAFDLQSLSKEHNVSNQTDIILSDIEIEGNGTILETHNLEQSGPSFTTSAYSSEDKKMHFINSKVSILKTPFPDGISPLALKDNMQFVETKKPTEEEYLYEGDLKNQEFVTVECDVILEDSNNTEKSLQFRHLNEKCCEITANICGQSKEITEDEDLYRETDHTANINDPKEIQQQDCNNLRETTVIIPGLDLLLPSENLEVNLGASAKSSPHKNTMFPDNLKCLQDCGETGTVSSSNADAENSNQSLSGRNLNDFVNSNKSKQSMDDTDISPPPVSIPGLDLLYRNIQQELATHNGTDENSTLTMEKYKHVVHTDIAVMNINRTSDSVCPKAKELHKCPPIFGNDVINECYIEQENEVINCEDNVENPIKFDAVTGEKDISSINKEGEYSNKESLTLTEDLNVINNIENNAKEFETMLTENLTEGNVAVKCQAPEAEMENIKNLMNISDDYAQRAKEDIKIQLKESALSRSDVPEKPTAAVNIEMMNDLELRSSKDYKSCLSPSKLIDKTKRYATFPDDNYLKSFGRKNVCIPVNSSLVVDEFPEANSFNDGKLLNVFSQKCLTNHEVIEEINNNPETDCFKKDTQTIVPLQNKCKPIDKDDRLKIAHQDLDVGVDRHSSKSQINTTAAKFTAEGVIEKYIKSPSQFNKPVERMVPKGSPNVKSVSRKSIESQRELLDGINAYSDKVESKLFATDKEISERSSSTNFDAIINFERNLSLLDKSIEQFDKEAEPIFKAAEKNEVSINNGDVQRMPFKNQSDSKEGGKSNAGASDDLRTQYSQLESITQFEKNTKHKPVTETFGKETKNSNTANNLSENQNLSILSHKISRILFTGSKIHLENENNTSIPDVDCDEQVIKTMGFNNLIPTPKQNTETVIITPSAEQIFTSKDLKNPKMINSPSCNHVSQHLNFCQDQNEDLMVNNVDIVEIPNISLNPVCTTPKTPRENISGSINGSLNTLKTSEVSDSYGLPNTLPSISTKCPTPPNFSGIFSKTAFLDSACENAAKCTKKSPKLKAYIIPAASVLCNVDNLQYATKASKKLHWEMLENKNEMTEIEDDSDVNSTDEEQPPDKKECGDNKMTYKEVPKSATNYSVLSPYKDLKSTKEAAAIESEGNKLSELFETFTPNLPKVCKLKKLVIPRRNTIDTLPILTDDTLEQFKQLTIANAATHKPILPFKVIKNQRQPSRMPKVLKTNLMTSSPVKVNCSESLMDSELPPTTMIESTQPISRNISAKAISKSGLNLAANCKKSNKLNANVQQLVPIQKKRRDRSPKQKVAEQNVEYKILTKAHEVIAPNQSEQRRIDPDTNCVKIAEENVAQNESLIQKDNYTFIKGRQCTAVCEARHNEEDLVHKLVSTESIVKSTSAKKDAANINYGSTCDESPVKTVGHNTSVIYEKLHSSDEQNSSVAENSEPECNKYLKEGGCHPTSKDTSSIEPTYIQELQKNYINDLKPPPKSADKTALINYKIPKLPRQDTSSSDNKAIFMEDISIKERPIKGHLSRCRVPTTVSDTKDVSKKSCAMETYIHSVECEKTKNKTLVVQEQRHRSIEISTDTFEGEQDKSTERCERWQTKAEKKTHNNVEIHHHHICNSRSKAQFLEKAEEISTLDSKKIAQSDNIIALNLNNDLFQVSGHDRNKGGNIKSRRKSMCVQITTENNEHLCDEYNTRRKVKPIKKSYLERNCDDELLLSPHASRNIKSSDNEESNRHTGLKVRRKSLNSQRKKLGTSSEDDGKHTPKSKQQELKTKKDTIAVDHKSNESITKSKTDLDESIKSRRSSSKTTKNKGSSKNETENERLPETSTGNSKIVNRINTSLATTDIYNDDGTEDYTNNVYYQYVQARELYLRLEKQLLGNICEDLQSNDKHSSGTNSASKNSKKKNKNIKAEHKKERRNTIHYLDSQRSNINHNKTGNIDEMSHNKTNESIKTVFEETKSSKTLFDHSPNMKLDKQSSDINQEQRSKFAKHYSTDLAGAEKKEKPSKSMPMRRKSMYKEKNSFDYTPDDCSDHLNLQRSKLLQINSDTNRLELGRYQDGNSRKSRRNRSKSMYMERLHSVSLDDNDTATKIVGNIVNEVHNDEARRDIYNSFDVKKTSTLKDKESLKLRKRKDTNRDPRKRENNVDTICTEKLSKTYGSTNLNGREIQEPNTSSIQGTPIIPIKSLRMLKKAMANEKGTLTSMEEECKKGPKTDKCVIEDIRNSIPQMYIDKDNSSLIVSGNELEVGINDSISTTTFSKHQQIGIEANRLDKSDDSHSDSDTLAIGQNARMNKMGIRRLQRRILDSPSSSGEEEEKIANLAKTVIDNENKETATILAVKGKRSARKRRIVKVLSTSLEDAQIVKKMKCTPPDQLEVATPATPTVNHPIFNSHVTEKSQSHLSMTPLSTDDRFQEIDSTLRVMFHSPQHAPEGNTLQAAQDSGTSVLAAEPQLNDSGANITVDETVSINRENDESSFNFSGSYDSKSLNSSASQDQSATKHLSLGTSNYRFEKVSENVVNLFISRKRKRNKRINT